MASDRPVLAVETREERGSRSSRRLRRAGLVPGVLYGGSHDEPVSFKVGDRELRRILNEGAALIDVRIGEDKSVPAIVKDRQLHPVRDEVVHIDFLEVNLKEKIRAPVSLELEGIDDAPGVKEGGVLDHATREVEIEALPTDIPEQIVVDVTALDIGSTITLADITVPEGVEIVHEHPDEVVVASVVLPTKVEEPEIEAETEVVGEEGEAAEGEGGEGSGDDDSGGGGE
ncbi:MAG TPA: 50S ribosomal protein L25 [Thermoleophilaceae bacterium]|nr:50S ribosomal protein L25 [Thermoleophilaceae bacterium]